MKFGDKLIQLRKKSGLSQEELAAKLNVSRQSVSKWESNNTYPETDKIVQICNIFDCTMDDLINENIKDITAIERKNKNQLNINIDSLLDFVTKTINMFCSMKLISILKCLIEIGFIAFILIMAGLLVEEIVTTIITNIFSFVPWKALAIIHSVIEGVINLAWIIITIIILIHIFKIRYLNYYEQIINDHKIKEEKTETEKKEKIKFQKKETHIVIRDKEPFAFLNVLTKVFLYFIKSIVTMIGLFFAFILLLGVIGLVLSLSLSAYSNIFVGADIGIIGVIIATVLILMIIIHFLLSTKVNIKIIITLFFISIILTGIGIGISLVQLKDITIAEDLTEIMKITTQEKEIKYIDNLIIFDHYPATYEYLINDDLTTNKIIVQNKFDSRFQKLRYYNNEIYGMNIYTFYLDNTPNIKDMLNIIINDLKNNTIRDYNTYIHTDDIKIVANKETIDKLISNFSKIYIYDIESIKDGYRITNISERIRRTSSGCYGEYNVLTDEFRSDDYCKCIKEENKTTGIIEYSCNYSEEE